MINKSPGGLTSSLKINLSPRMNAVHRLNGSGPLKTSKIKK
jgi:hypothetical protein